MNTIDEIYNIIHTMCPQASLQLPPLIEFGHLATNALMIKNINANELSEKLINSGLVARTELKDGFLNMWLNPNIINNNKLNLHFRKEKYSIEYGSPNPTGPVHVGHLRGMVVGDVLSKMMKIAGFDITTELYINDQGNQVLEFFSSIKHYIDPINYPTVFYKGKHLEELARVLRTDFTMDDVMEYQTSSIIQTMSKFNIVYDVITKESSLYKDLEEVLTILQPHLKEMDGKLIIDPTGKAPKVLRRPDGSYTYMAFDIAYHYNKYKRGFSKVICVLGEDHTGHFPQLIPIVKIFGMEFKLITIGTVSLKDGDNNVVMSKRAGTFIALDDLVQKISQDQLRTIMLNSSKHKAISFSMDMDPMNSPVFYTNYLIMRLEQLVSDFGSLSLKENHESEQDQWDLEDILRRIIYFPKIFMETINTLDPHRFFSYMEHFIKSLYGYMNTKPPYSLILKQAYDILLIFKKVVNFN